LILFISFIGCRLYCCVTAVATLATATIATAGLVVIFESQSPGPTGKQQGQTDNGDDADDFHFLIPLLSCCNV